jgi:hypothetical protein
VYELTGSEATMELVSGLLFLIKMTLVFIEVGGFRRSPRAVASPACDRADRGAIVGAWWVADILDLERSIWNRIHMGHGLDNYVIIC